MCKPTCTVKTVCQWTLSAMTSKHKMTADSVDTFVQRVLWEMAVRYVNVYILQQGQGEVCRLNYKTNTCGFASIPKLKFGFVWWDCFTLPHHAN